ncbi:MAG: NMD3-related protein [Candidatus Thermoplasmatota archaeon]|jgi:nonsense-mediated mRNA decay protein 3|nr:NMD3-related protein [Candidatus Thermoplasmatota archaeon]
MKPMFCVECGKEGPIFRDGVCISCYLKTHKFTKGPDIIDLTMCVNCDSYKFKNTWTADLFDDILRRTIRNTFYMSKELNNVEITTECKKKKETIECKLIISGFLDSIEISEEHNITIRIKKAVCDVCSRQSGGYYEAIIQIRPDRTKLSKQEIDDLGATVRSLVDQIRNKGNRALFITDEGEQHGGLDFFLSEKNSAQVIAKKIQEQYGGEIKQSAKNVGMKDSKQLYRMTYLIRLPAYRKNDFISYKKSFYLITSIHANRVHMIRLDNWEETSVDVKELEKTKILGGKNLVKEMIFVSQSKKEVQLMDSKTYETIDVQKPKNITYNTEKIKVVSIEDQIFLIP